MEFRTYLVYFHEFSYEFKNQRTPTEFGPFVALTVLIITKTKKEHCRNVPSKAANFKDKSDSVVVYRKIPKISPGAYIFQRPFLRGLFSEGLIYGGKFVFQNRLG